MTICAAVDHLSHDTGYLFMPILLFISDQIGHPSWFVFSSSFRRATEELPVTCREHSAKLAENLLSLRRGDNFSRFSFRFLENALASPRNKLQWSISAESSFHRLSSCNF